MNKGDIVRVKPNFHHPSRVGQTAKIISVIQTGIKHPINQYFVVFDDGLPDTLYEYDLELVTEEVIPSIQDLVDHDSIRFPDEPQKRTLDL